MLESVHCPTCSTHFGLKASRVRAGIHRARCFRCSSVFNIEREVLRLTSPLEAPAAKEHPDAEDLLPPLDFQDLQSVQVEPAELEEARPAGEDLSGLNLNDLEGMEEELFEKTQVMEERQIMAKSMPPAEEPQAARQPDAPPTKIAIAPSGKHDPAAGGYSSAKEAITKLLGNAPAPEGPNDRRNVNRASSQMDVEATLDALESTLGGVHAKDLSSKPASSAPAPDHPQPEPGQAKPMATTMKLTHDEILSAMKAASLPIPTITPRTPVVPVPVLAPTPRMAQPGKEAVPPVSPDPQASLLKIQVGQETYSNVTLEQISSWIEQGRVQDFHLVARQFSENWIEAGKVPSLRPVFERLRRQQVPAAQHGQAVILPPPNESAPMKKSLFGGLFNRG